jgi:TonB family protein
VRHLQVIPVRTDDPRLPAALMRERPSGLVRISFELNPDGSTGNVKVVSSTNRALNRASVDAVSNWKFMPVDEVLTIETELAYKYD